MATDCHSEGQGDHTPADNDDSCLQTPARGSGRHSKTHGRERASAKGGSGGKKHHHVSLNHLLAFTLPERQRPGAGYTQSTAARRYNTTSRSSHAQIRFLKERFVNANYRFIVKPTEDYTPYFADPDIFLEWKNILQVIVDTDPSIGTRLKTMATAASPTSSASGLALSQPFSAADQGAGGSAGKPNCPICLSTPQAARMTKCGHIFCFPCVLHYLQLSENGAKWRQCPICHESIYAKDLKSVKWYDSKTVKQEHLEISLDNRAEDESPVLLPNAHRDESLVTFRLVERPQLTTLALPRSPFWPPESNSRGHDVSRFSSIHSAPWLFVPDVFPFARFMQATPAYMRNELERDLVELEEERAILVALGERQKRARLAEAKRLAAAQAAQAQTQSESAAVASQRPFASAAYTAIRASSSNGVPSALSTGRPPVPGTVASSSGIGIKSDDLSAEASNDLSIMFVDSASEKVREQLVKVDGMKTQGVMTARKIAEHEVKNIQYIEREKERAAILAGTQSIVASRADPSALKQFIGQRTLADATTTTTDLGSSTNATSTSANEVETDRSGDLEDTASTSLPNNEPPSDWLALRDRASGSLGSSIVSSGHGLHLPSPASRKAKRNVNPPSSDAESFLFYQAASGSHIYLHPLEIKILKAHFGSYTSFPETLLLKVEHADESTMNDDLRKRCKYLSHLPSGCDVTFVEVDLCSVLGRKAIEPYAHAIKQRRQKRVDKARREEKARRDAIKREEDRALESVPSKTFHSSSPLPYAGPTNRSNTHHSPLSSSWRAAMEVAEGSWNRPDLERLSPDVIRSASTSPMGMSHLSLQPSSLPRHTLEDSMDFPRIAITPPKENFSLQPERAPAGRDVERKTVWGTKAVAPNQSDDMFLLKDHRALDDDGDFAVEDGWLKHFEEDTEGSRASTAALDEEGRSADLAAARSKKKTKKKLVLMSTGGRRTA